MISTETTDVLSILKSLQKDKANRLNPDIPRRLKTCELAERLECSIREAADAIAQLRDEGFLVANVGGGYFIAETREQMEDTLGLYKHRAMTALVRLKKMQRATNEAFPEDEQRDFFKEAIDEA